MDTNRLKNSAWPSDRLLAASNEFERGVSLLPERDGYWELWFEKIESNERQITAKINSVAHAFVNGACLPSLTDMEAFCFSLRLRFAAIMVGHFETGDTTCPIPLLAKTKTTTESDLIIWLLTDAWDSFGRSLMSIFVYDIEAQWEHDYQPRPIPPPISEGESTILST